MVSSVVHRPWGALLPPSSDPSRHSPSVLRGNVPASLPFGAARLPRAFGGGAEAGQGHKVFLEARVGRPQPLPLPLRGEERVLEPHAGGRRLQSQRIAKEKVS